MLPIADHRGWLCVAALFLFGTACGDEEEDHEEPGPSMGGEDPTPADDATELGGIDGAGVLDFQVGNTHPNGPVVTTLGDFMVEVRSVHALRHEFDATTNRLFLGHSVTTPKREQLRFQFDYTGGTESFPISDLGDYRELKDKNGWLVITEDGQEFVARTGTVTIESIDGAAVQIALDGLGVIPFDPLVPEDLTEIRLVGSGLVSGPLVRRCYEDDEQLSPPPFPAPFDDAELDEFCGGEYVQR